ncbi:MAG TPA: glycosyltransferase [Candidatus Omnitrophota bacterium]|nr:glycosyltransferase [Candidatus Omnitrophota bacterium]
MSTERMPIVSVVMPCYNAARFLREAVESILSQSFSDLELIVVNDASTDATKEILMEYQAKDGRVVYAEHVANRGVSESLNTGLRLVRGEFVARMDADDIAEPERLAKQVALLRRDPEIVVCGTFLTLIDENGKKIGKRDYDVDSEVIKKRFMRRSPVAHPSVVIRKQILNAHHLEYRRKYFSAEDYDLWLRLMPYGKFANVGEPLLRYRLSSDALTVRRCKTALWSTIRLKWRYLRYADLASYGNLMLEMILMLLPKNGILFLYRKFHGVQ